jgi:hypothetical protein
VAATEGGTTENRHHPPKHCLWILHSLPHASYESLFSNRNQSIGEEPWSANRGRIEGFPRRPQRRGTAAAKLHRFGAAVLFDQSGHFGVRHADRELLPTVHHDEEQ